MTQVSHAEMEEVYESLKTCKILTRFALEDLIKPESIASHSFGVAVIAFAIALWMKENLPLGVSYSIDPNALAVKALLHDYPEIVTGDLNYWVKNSTGEFRKSWEEMEEARMREHMKELPEFFRNVLNLSQGETCPIQDYILKCSDYIDFTLKMLHEARLGNTEGLRLARIGVSVIEIYRVADYEKPGNPVECFVAYFAAEIRRLSDGVGH